VHGSDRPILGDLVFEKEDDNVKMSTDVEEESIALADDANDKS